MRDNFGRFIDGEEGKEHRFTSERLMGNKHRQNLIPTNAFPKGHKPLNFIGEKPREVESSRDGLHREITINKKIERKDYKGRTILVRKRINYARYLWEKHKGQLKKGWVVAHIDRDKLNDDLDNLIALPRKEFIKFCNGKL
jgi:hypothetical protein